VGAALKQSRAALALFLDLGGFARVTQLLLWTALAFAPAAGRCAAGGGSGPAPGAGSEDGVCAAGDGPASMSSPGKAPHPVVFMPVHLLRPLAGPQPPASPFTLHRLTDTLSRCVCPPSAHGEADAPARAAGAVATDAPPPAGAAARPPPLRVRPPAQARQELGALFGVLADWLDLSPPAAARRASLGQRDRRAAGAQAGAAQPRQPLRQSLGLG